MPVVGYLIQTDDNTNILVDTDLPHGNIARPQELPGGLRVEMREDDYVVNRPASVGMHPKRQPMIPSLVSLDKYKGYAAVFIRLIIGFHLIYGTQDNVRWSS